MFDQLKLSAWSSSIQGTVKMPLRIELWNGKIINFSDEQPCVTIQIPTAAALPYILSPSLYNLGRAYVEGYIQVKGCAADMISVVNGLAASTLKRQRPVMRGLRVFSQRNRHDDAAAIRYHYDVSNDFYAAWLDPRMVYSCGYFKTGTEDLAQAQEKKIDHILNKIGLKHGESLLDIGCGWGALVMRAAERYQARCVGVTLSENQAQLASERVERAGLMHLVTIRLQDYRDVDGKFDRITSVGMFGHVGVQNLPAYFRHVNALLNPGGMVMNHGITTTDVRNGETPYVPGKFIEEYVFPHGELAHLSTVVSAMQEGGLEVYDVENLRRHDAKTCEEWTKNFESNTEQIANLVDQRQYRILHIYLAGCAYTFAHDWISLFQIVCGKAGANGTNIPWSRKYMYP